MGQRLAVIAMGAPTTETFAMVSPTSHRGRQNKVSFKIGGGERRFLSQLVKDQKSKANGSTPCCLYHRGKSKRPFGTHARDNAWCARHHDLFVVQTVQCPTHCEWRLSMYDNNIDSPGMVRLQRRRSIMHTIVKGGACSLFLQQRNPNKPMT
jgi:hypothetical protein